MSEIIVVDFARRAIARPTVASAAAASLGAAPDSVSGGTAVIPLPPPLAAAMPATASLIEIVAQLREGTRNVHDALQQMREGSAALIRLSADMTQHTGALAGQIGAATVALQDFGDAMRRMRDA